MSKGGREWMAWCASWIAKEQQGRARQKKPIETNMNMLYGRYTDSFQTARDWIRHAFTFQASIV